MCSLYIQIKLRDHCIFLFFRMKRHKTVLGANISGFLILLISVQLPYLIFFAIELSSASNDAPQHFNDIDFTSK